MIDPIIYYVHQQNTFSILNKESLGVAKQQVPCMAISHTGWPEGEPGYSTQDTGGCWMMPDVYNPTLQKETQFAYQMCSPTLGTNTPDKTGCGTQATCGYCIHLGVAAQPPIRVWLVTKHGCGCCIHLGVASLSH